MFADYESLIVLDYQKKIAANNAFPLSLIQPTPARLKAECLAVCNKRFERKDERTLRAFFGEGGDKGASLQAINRCDVDKFRPLNNFLKESTGTTDPKNIELLAWLIDFKDRPFELGKKYIVNRLGEPKRPEDIPVGKTGRTPGAVIGQSKGSQTKVRMAIIAVVTLIIVSGVTYLLRTNKPSAPSLTGREACMFWAEDHYQPISCAQKLENIQVIALDSERINHFRKITRSDTITPSAVGSVWYVKYRGNMEYYTSGGYHPTDLRLRLLPITDYIIRKHIHSDQEAGQISK